MAQQTKNQIKSYFEAGDRPNDVEFGHLFDSIVFLNTPNQGSNTDITTLAGGLTLGGTLTLTGTTDFKMGGNILIGNLNENLTRPIQAYSSTNETIVFASGSISNVQYEGISGDATASIKLKDNYASTATAIFGTHTGKAFIAVGDNEVFNISASNASYNSFFSGSVGIGTESPAYTLDLGENSSTIRLVSENNGTAIRIGAGDNSNDVTLIRVDGSTTNNDGESDDSSFGFSLKYMGSRGGNENSFSIFSDNQTGTAEEAFSILQNGNIGIGISNPSDSLHVKGSTSVTRIKIQTTTGNAHLVAQTDLSHFAWFSRGNINRFDLLDVTNSQAIMRVFGDNSVGGTLALKEGKVGIGTDNPEQKLDVAGGHIQLDNNYGLIRFHTSAGNPQNYGFYPFLTGMPTSFSNITPLGTIQSSAMSLQSDAGINFIETDSNILVGHMNVNEKKFDWDGDINANKVFANELHGDGSNITNIVGSQISGFVNSPGNNRVLTSVDSTGNAIQGESDFTFDGTDVKLDGNLAIGKGTAGLFSPDAPLHIRHEGSSLGNVDLIHLSSQDVSGISESNISIKFSDKGDVANQHFKITFGEGNNDLKFHSDTVDNILYLEHGGQVGIGTSSPNAKLTVDGSIKSLEGSIGNLNTTDDKGQQMEFGTDAVTTLRFDADRWRLYAGGDGGAFEVFTVLEDGKIGIGTTAPSEKLHVKDASNDVFIQLETDKTDGVAQIKAFNDAHRFDFGIVSNDSFRITNRGPLSAPSTTVPFIISPSAIDNLLFIDDTSVIVGGNSPFGTSKLTVKGRFTSEAGLDEDYIRFSGPNVTLSAQHPDAPGGSVPVSAGLRRITGQGGIGMFSDSCLVLHAGDHVGTLATAVSAFHGRGDGSPTDNNNESIHLIADGTIQLRTNAQNGLTSGDIHHYTFNQGGLIVNGTSSFNITRYKLQVDGGGIAIDSNGNGDRGMIIQGAAATGIGLLGNDSRATNTRMDLHVEDDGRVTIGNVAPHGSSPLTIQSRGTNTDAINLVSAGTNATRIVQISDTTSGNGLIDILNNDGTHSARFFGAGSSFLSNNLGIGTSSPSVALHIKGTTNEKIRLQDDQDGGDPYMSFYDNEERRAYIQSVNAAGTGTGNELRLVSEAGEITFRTAATDGTRESVPPERMVIRAGGKVGIGTTTPGQMLTINGDDGFNSGIGIQRAGVLYARIVTDSEGLKFQTKVAGDGYYFRNSANQTSLFIGDNSHVAIGESSTGTGLNYPMGLTSSDLGAYLEVQNERGGDGKSALIGAWGVGQGDGIMYVGQSVSYGGGVVYRGDATNPSELNNLPADHIALFRQTAEASLTSAEAESTGVGTHPVMSTPHWNSRVKFWDQVGIYTSTNQVDVAANGAAGRPALTIKSQVQGGLSQTNGSTGGGIRLIDNDSSNYWELGFVNNNLYFSFSNSSTSNILKAFLNTDYEGQLTFTGQHRSKPSTGTLSDYDDKIGQIVIADGTYSNIDVNIDEETPTINEAVPKVKLSTKANDKRVFGVISNKEDENKDFRTDFGALTSTFPMREGDYRLFINSIGEGAIWVSDYNGNLENGDYITTSPIEGVGMKQDDDLLHNYTVAKITQDCDFSEGAIDAGNNYKKKLVGCTYHCG